MSQFRKSSQHPAKTLESFLRGHVEALAAFHGVARTLVYDNLHSVVLERAGTAIRLRPATPGPTLA